MFDVEKFKLLIENNSRVAIFTHPFPDPDAIGSMMGMKWMFSKFGLPADLFYIGAISHPQNRSMVNLLDPELSLVDFYNKKEVFHRIYL